MYVLAQCRIQKRPKQLNHELPILSYLLCSRQDLKRRKQLKRVRNLLFKLKGIEDAAIAVARLNRARYTRDAPEIHSRSHARSHARCTGDHSMVTAGTLTGGVSRGGGWCASKVFDRRRSERERLRGSRHHRAGPAHRRRLRVWPRDLGSSRPLRIRIRRIKRRGPPVDARRGARAIAHLRAVVQHGRRAELRRVAARAVMWAAHGLGGVHGWRCGPGPAAADAAEAAASAAARRGRRRFGRSACAVAGEEQ